MAAGYANPVFIPIADPQCAWETVVGVVSAYFRVEHEEPVRLIGNTLTEGSITTFPRSARQSSSLGGTTRSIPSSGSRTRCSRCVAGRWSA